MSDATRADAFVAAIVEHWPEYPEAEGIEIAAKVGKALVQPLQAVLNGAEEVATRRLLVEMMSATGAPESERWVKELAASRSTNDRKTAERCITALARHGVHVVVEKKKRTKPKTS